MIVSEVKVDYSRTTGFLNADMVIITDARTRRVSFAPGLIDALRQRDVEALGQKRGGGPGIRNLIPRSRRRSIRLHLRLKPHLSRKNHQ